MLLYSFLVATRPLKRNVQVRVEDGTQSYVFIARAGHSRHYYTNIPVAFKPTLNVPFPHKMTELAFGEDLYVTEEQRLLNVGMTSFKNVSYRVSVRGFPRRAVVTFPHYKGVGGWPAPYALLDGSRLELEDTLYISFQDPYWTMGTYFLSDSYGSDPVPAAEEAIRQQLTKHGLTSDKCTFLGSSKGANIAALVSSRFSDGRLVLCAYSTDLEYRIRNTHYSHLGTMLDRFAISIPDTLEILTNEASAKETHWFYSIGDDLANRGNENIEVEYLTSHPCAQSHSRVMLDNWDSIRSLIHQQ